MIRISNSLAPVIAGAIAMCLAAILPETVQAAEKVRFAYLRTQSLAVSFHAKSRGYFKDEGLEVEFIEVQGGPAVGAAIASGSADFGFAAPAPIALARQAGQPFRFFIGLQWERSPDSVWGFLLASERSGVKSLKDLAGKTIIVGPAGGLCELAFRDWLATAGLTLDKVKVLYTPFPQQQAALELGNADAACTVEPFHTAMQNSKVKPVTLAKAFLANQSGTYNVDGLFASEAWLEKNGRVVAALRKALTRARDDMRKDQSIGKRILLEEFKLPAGLVEKLPNADSTISLTAADFKPLIDGMKRNGMLKDSVSERDIVFEGK